MLKRIVVPVLALILALTSVAPALAAEGPGTIQGSLVNKTAGTASSVAGLDMVLVTLKNGLSAGEQTAKTDAGGKFSFANLETDTATAYIVKLVYQGGAYQTAPVSFDAGETSRTVDVPVYDAVRDDSVLRVDTAHTIIAPGEGGLIIYQLFFFANDSDKAYIGDKDPSDPAPANTLFFSVPDEASELQFDGIGDAALTDDGLASTAAVLPGKTQVVIQYIVPLASSRTYQFSEKLTLPVSTYNLFVEGKGAKVTTTQLSQLEPVEDTANNQYFNRFSGKGLARGANLVVEMSNLGAAASGGGPSTSLIMLAGLGVLAVVAALLVLRLRRNRSPQTALAAAQIGEPVVEEAVEFESRQDVLLAELARLDDEFESGAIAEAAYKKERAARKAELLELMRGTGDAGDSAP